jgi:hypothetical protein
MSEFFTDDEYYTGPMLTDELVAAAEERLGFSFPQAYLDLLTSRNGGVPRNRCIRTPYRTSWAIDHFEIAAILGIGGAWGVDSETMGSAAMIREWGYPRIGIVICDMPSAGHDAVMLDYEQSASDPTVVYIDEDRLIRPVARSFEEFANTLEPCSSFNTPE